MQKEVFEFFEKYIDVERPVLLGLSGGPDSTLLLHMLLLWNKAKVHLVHVDHGWRRESEGERLELQKMAEELGLPFHHTRLDPSKYTGNKEAESRKERYRFFKEVADRVGANAILLGHHADDLSETVFKRVLEGSSLVRLSGMQERRTHDLLVIIRPLLGLTKAEVVAWLDKRKITYFVDPTNLETRYLRGALRQEIFPYLKKHFGKEFEGSLRAIGQEAQELNAFLDEACVPYYSKALHGPWGILCQYFPQAPYLQKHLIRLVCEELGITFSREQMQLAQKLIPSANKQIISGTGILALDRARGFFMPTPIDDIEGSVALSEGSMQFGNWLVDVTRCDTKAAPKNHFIDAWKGHLSTYVPVGKYVLTLSTPKMRHIANKEYGDYLTEKKIPHFFTQKVPVLVHEGIIVEDFLTGCCPQNSGYRISCSLLPKCI